LIKVSRTSTTHADQVPSPRISTRTTISSRQHQNATTQKRDTPPFSRTCTSCTATSQPVCLAHAPHACPAPFSAKAHSTRLNMQPQGLGLATSRAELGVPGAPCLPSTGCSSCRAASAGEPGAHRAAAVSGQAFGLTGLRVLGTWSMGMLATTHNGVGTHCQKASLDFP
jgi:hypothetical protein